MQKLLAMAKKTARKLSLKRETLRTLSDQQLQTVVGGHKSGVYCTVGNGSNNCGSVTADCAPRETGGSIENPGSR